ncbi:TIGR03767 family metallophosphoesterase [Nocardioides sp. cx-169]|uniref:TIGR03767 family metallophosphoesterase n=1 Tax=Nocardioides sp. cx-169 TaxID=2899080 RepID=UPI001E4D90A5|nr:TIGR03767 family metallophosphoesterase [Nocardioides sp. cx-169]MCD4536061.1 TIGR03767 family metallophosphoesterase [Nocardioides sp. cx-169]
MTRPRSTEAATAASVLGRGDPGSGGYAGIVRREGEPHVVRTDLAEPGPHRAAERRPLLALVQLSDVHVVDAQSPLRVEWADRFDDPVFASAHRPQEMLSGHVADAMVRAVNRVARGPVTGLPLSLAIQTGDNSDSSQHNEVRWNIDLLDGGPVRLDSGDLSRYEGVADSDPDHHDPHYWHPDGSPTDQPDDLAHATYGFPRVPGLLDAARRPFQAEGLAMPWYAALGNHDGLVQGNFPRTGPVGAVAVGSRKLVSPPPGVSEEDTLAAMSGDYTGFITALTRSAGARTVTPDPDRRVLARGEIVEEHFHTTGTPVGHGFTEDNRREGTAYYVLDPGPVVLVALDTVNPHGFEDGSLDLAQLAWLSEVLARSADRVVVVFSHHPSDRMDNAFVTPGADPEAERRVLGHEVLDLLLAHDRVVAWVNGHTHGNRIAARHRSGGGGLWEITTASHIDWPQQSRLLELADNLDGTLSIFTTMLDHAGPAAYDGRLDDPVQLAGLAREIAANDWHGRSDVGLGAPSDRNTELVVAVTRS